MLRGILSARAFAAIFFLHAAGCAVFPTQSASDLKAPLAHREILAEAAAAVEKAPWPKSEPVSLLARMTGGGDRISRSDAIAYYMASLEPAGARFSVLAGHARNNLDAAHALNDAALRALDAPRLSINDVVLIEGAMQALRAQGEIYTIAARQIAKAGESVDEARLEILREDYREAIKTLSVTADLAVERIAHDESATMAGPDETVRRNFSDL